MIKHMSIGKKYNIAIVGALGMVGQEMLRTLQERNFPIGDLILLDQPQYINKKIEFQGEFHRVEAAVSKNFINIDIALFSAGSAASLLLAPEAVKKGAIVIDNSSAWRMNSDCPLVVPEVNPNALLQHKGIIANPNCSTIQMVVALKPIHDYAKITRLVISTYQAVSGSGKHGLDALIAESKEYLDTGAATPQIYDYQIAFNCIPHIDIFQENNYTKEEYKMINETNKILDSKIKVSATCVRVAVLNGHSESINIETERKITAGKARILLHNTTGIKLLDDVKNNIYPMAILSNDEDLTLVGRIREDLSIENGLNIWVVSNNIRKGAALNAVQIAETLIEKKLI
jgi:aspartate-semialdehyde dehydrogenase